jgi:hypothetical protein|tara:strand:+ start:800 stop:1366 length:567 start_codon:yes stop_codon:yes gene_type:complete
MDETFNNLIKQFIDQIRNGDIDLYNEFSLQHELGIHLRENLPYKIQFERNVSYFEWEKSNFIKKEIDISIFKDIKSPQIAIELKYPRNGQYPEQMYSFCKDIMFIEQLKNAGFNKSLLMILVDDEKFYQGLRTDGIYKYFRSKGKLTGSIIKPTGKSVKNDITIKGEYYIDWIKISNKYRYTLIDSTL